MPNARTVQSSVAAVPLAASRAFGGRPAVFFMVA